ncbi:MAG: polysaccharide pyruvyl transferase family protein [Bacteroidales bacterium]|nr:polysaccharide pyruvyl transferase family protein [Bacteroidales bacterium]
MKIGIMTFWWSDDNYGQLLQCYALQKFLRDLGHDVFLIRYHEKWQPRPFYMKLLITLNPVRIYNYLAYKVKKRKLQKEKRKFDRKFDDFKSQFIRVSEQVFSTFEELKNAPPVADIYIVGSDQVWNPSLGGFNPYNFIHAYFLDFGEKKIKRYSYAASFGQVKLEQKWIKEITPLLKKFDYVSVREKNGIELCKQCGVNNAEWVVDPTLLLTADDYRTLYYKYPIRKPEKKYLLLYMLGNKCNINIATVYEFANKKKLDVIYVTGNSAYDNYPKNFATIQEWIYLIDNAEYVITNSFHCGVFSTIFHKQFGIIALSGKFKGMNARIDSLFEVCGTGRRYVSNNDYRILDKQYDIKKTDCSLSFKKKLYL